MDITVFYAWQDDRPGKYTRYLIRDAAKEACRRITDEPSNDWGVSVDEATQGVPGMCDIPNTILEKIRTCDVFLADLTFVGGTDAENDDDVQLISNPNVVFELGYAVDAKGFDRILGVMNVAYGEPERQMFDVKRRWAIRYDLPENSDKPEIQAAQRRLSSEIEGALRTILEKVVLPDKGEKASERFERIRTDFEASIRDGCFHGLDRESGAIAIGIVPDATPSLDHLRLQLTPLLPPIGMGSKCEPRGRSVVCMYETEGPGDRTGQRVRCSVTEMTVDGVILAADTYYLDPKKPHRSNAIVAIVRIIPAQALEQVVVRSVLNYAQVLQGLQVAFPWRVAVSLIGVRGYRMSAEGARWGREIDDRDDIRADAVLIRGPEETSNQTTIARSLKEAFDYIWRECGYPRSLYYDGDGNWKGPFWR